MTDSATTATTDRRSRFASLALGIGLVVLVALGAYQGRGFPFIVDEWNILGNYATGGWLEPYNGHLSLVPVIIYQGLAHLVGIKSHFVYLLVGLGIFCALAIGWFRLHRRAIGPVLAALGALAIVWSQWSTWSLVYPMMMVFTLPALAMVIAWGAIARDEVRSDWLAVAVLAVALATSATGVIAVIAIVTELVLRRAPLRRLVRFAPAPALWFLWWLFFHDPTAPASISERLSYAWKMAVAILSGVTFGFEPGAVLVVIGLVALLVAAWRWGNLDAHVISIIVAAACFIVLSAWSRAGIEFLNSPDSPRYVWFGGFLIIELVASCIRGRRVPDGAIAAAAIAVLIGGISMAGNLFDLRTASMARSGDFRPSLVGAEAAGPAADRNRILPLNFIPVTVGEYLDLVDRFGSPVGDLPFADLGSLEAREQADAILIDEENLSIENDAGWSCPNAPATAVADTFEVPPGGTLMLTAGEHPLKVTVRRMALEDQSTPIGSVPPGSQAVVKTARDGSMLPWIFAVDGPAVSGTVCAPSPDHEQP